MARLRHYESWISSRMGIMVALGLAVLLTSPEATWALPKNPVYKKCACRCVAAGEIVGEIIDFSNTAGIACGAYNNVTCNHEDPSTGGVRSGTTKDCGPYKPGGTVQFRMPMRGATGSVLSRGIEGEPPAESEMVITIPSDDTQSGEVQERAVPRRALPGRSLSFTGCGCNGGSGTCTVSTNPSPGGDQQTCYKGTNDTCAGTCDFGGTPSPGGTVIR